MTGGRAAKNNAAASHDAVIAAFAPICVERFREQTDPAVKTNALVNTSSWERGNMVEKAGYTTMPGSKTTDSAFARAEILAIPAVPKS